MAEKTEIVENQFGVDVAVNTIRGRACPVCGGKIIPSNRAVYQSAGDPAEVFPLWECERCGFAETFAKPEEPKKVHGAAAKALTGEKAKTSTATSAGAAQAEARTSGRAAANRAIPPDVRKMLEVMKREQPKAEK
ncbi:MAG: hypothetical protein JOZ52_11555 [Acidobacteria bacterium]|nr:hypothetical protein [Acidobacteriota bacterium]